MAPLIPNNVWDDVAAQSSSSLHSTRTGSTITEADQIRLDSSGSDEFGLTRYWPLPLYIVACVIHKRYRAWSPRRLPYLTTMKPPEFYGILALGHLADIEARRLTDKLDSGKEQDRKNVAIYSIVMAKIYHEHLHKLKDMPSYDIAETIAFAESYEKTLAGHIQERADAIPWRLRTMWSDDTTRTIVSFELEQHMKAHNMSDHDKKTLIAFVAERIKTRNFYRPSIIFEGGTLRMFALWTAVAMFTRWSAPRGLLTLLYNGHQRVAFCVLAYRALGGMYTHYSSLWTFEEPAKAARVVEDSIHALVEKYSGTAS